MTIPTRSDEREDERRAPHPEVHPIPGNPVLASGPPYRFPDRGRAEPAPEHRSAWRIVGYRGRGGCQADGIRPRHSRIQSHHLGRRSWRGRACCRCTLGQQAKRRDHTDSVTHLFHRQPPTLWRSHRTKAAIQAGRRGMPIPAPQNGLACWFPGRKRVICRWRFGGVGVAPRSAWCHHGQVPDGAARAWFGLLGPLCVRYGGAEVAVPAARHRVLLAALVVRVGHVLSVDELAEAVWDGEPPPGARVTLRSYVKRLRQVLGPVLGQRIVARDPGYLITAGDAEVDLKRFEELCKAGRRACDTGAW